MRSYNSPDVVAYFQTTELAAAEEILKICQRAVRVRREAAEHKPGQPPRRKGVRRYSGRPAPADPPVEAHE